MIRSDHRMAYLFISKRETSTPTRPVDNVVIATKGLQDGNTNLIAGTTVENKGKLILSLIMSTFLIIFGLKRDENGSGEGSTMRNFIVCTVHLI